MFLIDQMKLILLLKFYSLGDLFARVGRHVEEWRGERKHNERRLMEFSLIPKNILQFPFQF